MPAYIHYMTAVDKNFGNFAIEDNMGFMVLDRRYDWTPTGIGDLTTYVDPVKYNQVFAQTELDSMNFKLLIKSNINARRKIARKQIPNL